MTTSLLDGITDIGNLGTEDPDLVSGEPQAVLFQLMPILALADGEAPDDDLIGSTAEPADSGDSASTDTAAAETPLLYGMAPLLDGDPSDPSLQTPVPSRGIEPDDAAMDESVPSDSDLDPEGDLIPLHARLRGGSVPVRNDQDSMADQNEVLTSSALSPTRQTSEKNQVKGSKKKNSRTLSARSYIADDGTGSIFTNETIKSLQDQVDDDRTMRVRGTTANEASDYLLWRVGGSPGQEVTFKLGRKSDTGSIGKDIGPRLKVLADDRWQAYNPDRLPTIGSDGILLVRAEVKQDEVFEGPQSLTLAVTFGKRSRSGSSSTDDSGSDRGARRPAPAQAAPPSRPGHAGGHSDDSGDAPLLDRPRGQSARPDHADHGSGKPSRPGNGEEDEYENHAGHEPDTSTDETSTDETSTGDASSEDTSAEDDANLPADDSSSEDDLPATTAGDDDQPDDLSTGDNANTEDDSSESLTDPNPDDEEQPAQGSQGTPRPDRPTGGHGGGKKPTGIGSLDSLQAISSEEDPAFPGTYLAVATPQRDLLTGSPDAATTFQWTALQDSLLGGSGKARRWDVVQDLDPDRGDRLDAPASVLSTTIEALSGSVGKLNAGQIQRRLLNKKSFEPDTAAAFNCDGFEGTFIVFNDGQSGYQKSRDTLLFLQDYSFTPSQLTLI